MNDKNACRLIQPLQARHSDYLTDESRISGTAETISFPETEIQVQAIVKTLLKSRTRITVQGSRTGLAGNAVPVGGHLLNLSKMTRVTGMEQDQEGHFFVRVQPGISLLQLDQLLASRRFDGDGWDLPSQEALSAFKTAGRFFWPPDPSERSASIGGIAATNGRGITALYYGLAHCHIQAIRLVDAKGDIQTIPRGSYVFSQGVCPLPGADPARLDQIDLQNLPQQGLPDPYDLLDLYLGSLGMFGVMTELTLRLQPVPKQMWGVVFFFACQACAIDFIQAVTAITRQQHGKQQSRQTPSRADIVAIDVMDQTTLDMIGEYKRVNSRLAVLPDMDASLSTAVYVEIHGSHSEALETLSENLLEKMVLCDGDPDNTWAFCSEMERERLRLFRHAAAESIGLAIDRARRDDPRITRLGADVWVQKGSLVQTLDACRRDMDGLGLEAAIFGHAPDGPIHVNILPRDYQQFERGNTLIKIWASKSYGEQNSRVTAPGAEKTKHTMAGPSFLSGQPHILWAVKKQLDPDGLWNSGSMPDFKDNKTITINGNRK